MQDRKKHIKRTVAYSIVYPIILVALAVAFFFIPTKTNAGWVALGFTALAVIITTVFSAKLAKNADTNRKAFYAKPVIKVATVYAVVQIIIGITLCVVSIFKPFSAWISTIVCLLWFIAAIASLIAANAVKKAIAPIETETEVKIRKVTEFRIDMTSVFEACRSDEIRRELEKLADDFKYSDPVSSPDTVEIEKKIASEIADLAKKVEADKTEKAKEGIRTVRNLLSERNRICKAYKTIRR